MKMIFNGCTYKILEVSGRDPLPFFSINKLQLTRNHVVTNSFFSNRQISVRLLLKDENRQNLQNKIDKLNRDMYVDTERKKLIFDDLESRYWLAICQSITTIKEGLNFAELKLTFDCYPLSYDTALSTGGKMIENTGSYSALPIIEFSLPAGTTDFVCGIDGTISKICLTGDLSGQWKIDSENRKVYLDGALANDMFDYENSLWSGFELPAGKTTTFMVSLANIQLNISYRRRWL